ncbi:MAG: DUF3500 domain-containing protein [Vicinamibacterales bacterium]
MRLATARRGILAFTSVLLFWWASPQGADQSPGTMAEAASALLDALTVEQRGKAAFELGSSERTTWQYESGEMALRLGLPLGEMTPGQKALAQKLLDSALSQRGRTTVRGIMDLELISGSGETSGDQSSGSYCFAVFGTPESAAWGWRVQGHHLALNFTITNGVLVATAPLFLGSEPAEVRTGPEAGRRVLGQQEDAGRALVMSLDDEQRSEAIFSATPPDDILTANQSEAERLTPEGLRFSEMTEIQRITFFRLLDAYVSLMAPDVAADRETALENADFDRMTFGWAGSTVRGAPHYYRVQGRDFLIEFANTQGGGNHAHAVWRDFTGDFGRDLLREPAAPAR